MNLKKLTIICYSFFQAICFGENKVFIEIVGCKAPPKYDHIHRVNVYLSCSWTEKPLVYHTLIPFEYKNGLHIVFGEKIVALHICARFYIGSKELPDKRLLLLTEDIIDNTKKATRYVILDEKAAIVKQAPITVPDAALYCEIEEKDSVYTAIYFDEKKKEISRDKIEL